MGNSVVVVLTSRKRLHELQEQLAALQPAPTSVLAIGAGEVDIQSVERLNPALGRKRLQKSMARWLIPFGFIAGVSFTYMTDLQTFSFLGPLGEPVVGGLLGLGSGWMGSFAAAASVTSEEDDRIRGLRNRLSEGNWLLLVETPSGVDLPWTTLQQASPKAVVRLSED